MDLNAPKNDEIHVKTNHELKIKAIKVLEKNGLDLDTALNLTLEKIVDEDKFPFEKVESYKDQLKRFEKELDKGIQSYEDGDYTTFSDLKEEFEEWRRNAQ